MAELKNLYENEFKPENYIKNRKKELTNNILKFNWTVSKETILQKFKECYNNGYSGFHFIDGCYPAELIEEYVNSFFDDKYIVARFCKTHKKNDY